MEELLWRPHKHNVRCKYAFTEEIAVHLGLKLNVFVLQPFRKKVKVIVKSKKPKKIAESFQDMVFDHVILPDRQGCDKLLK